jgi:acetylglutamate kinase
VVGEELGLVGVVDSVNVDVIDHIAEDYIPVIASVGTDSDGRPHNINADEAAGKVAAAMGAQRAIFLTDVEGWLHDPEDPSSLVRQATAAEVSKALPGLEGGMKPKLSACVEAVTGGVEAAQIIDGRVPHSLLLELFTDRGVGTKIIA